MIKLDLDVNGSGSAADAEMALLAGPLVPRGLLARWRKRFRRVRTRRRDGASFVEIRQALRAFWIGVLDSEDGKASLSPVLAESAPVEAVVLIDQVVGDVAAAER